MQFEADQDEVQQAVNVLQISSTQGLQPRFKALPGVQRSWAQVPCGGWLPTGDMSGGMLISGLGMLMSGLGMLMSGLGMLISGLGMLMSGLGMLISGLGMLMSGLGMLMSGLGRAISCFGLMSPGGTLPLMSGGPSGGSGFSSTQRLSTQ